MPNNLKPTKNEGKSIIVINHFRCLKSDAENDCAKINKLLRHKNMDSILEFTVTEVLDKGYYSLNVTSKERIEDVEQARLFALIHLTEAITRLY